MMRSTEEYDAPRTFKDLFEMPLRPLLCFGKSLSYLDLERDILTLLCLHPRKQDLPGCGTQI
jgi:hypothetical protein